MVRLLLSLLVLSAAPASAAPGEVRVLMRTSAGPILIAVDTRHAPITATNFLRYVDAKRFDGMKFYRAARSKRDPQTGLVQGGIEHRMKLSFFPIAHEPTTRTGLHHVDGTISMARNDPGTAMGDFFICIGPSSYLDAAPNYAGYAAFGRVISGMATAKRILALKTYPGGYSKETIGQTIVDEPAILSVRRVP